MCEFCILHCIRPRVKLNGWNESFFSFSALVRITPVADPPRSPHLHADPGLWNRASDWTLLFYFCPPFARFPLIECVLSIRGGFQRGGWVLVGWLVGEEEEEGGRGEEEVTEGGSVAQVVMMKGVFHSFTLPVFPLFSCLRRLIKRAWIVDVTLSVSPPPPPPPLFLVSHPHILPSSPPSLSILTLSSVSTCDHRHPSSHSLAHNASQWPLTGGQRGKKKKKKNKLKFSLNVNIEAADLYFLYFLFTQCERKCQGHSMATLLFTPMFIQMDFSCRQ